MLSEALPDLIVDIAISVELIASGKERAIFIAPYWIVFAPFRRRRDLIVIKTGAFCKDCDMNTPLIFGPYNAMTLSITISRWRSVRCPGSSSPPAINF